MTNILAIDQGTTSSRAIIFDKDLKIVASAQEEFEQHYPQAGWVEHDANEIWRSQRETIQSAMAQAGVTAGEIAAVESGELPRDQNPLKLAPHTAAVVCGDSWERPYSRQRAAFPLPWVGENKFWPAVGRIDNAFGDRNLMCTCPPLEAYEAAE